MLSDLIDSYAGHFGDWAGQGGVRMDARLCAILQTNLAEMADQARRLEGQPVPETARPLPPGVVRLDDFRRVGAELVHPGQGDGGRAA